MAKAVQAGQQAANVTGRPAAIPGSRTGLYLWAADQAARHDHGAYLLTAAGLRPLT